LNPLNLITRGPSNGCPRRDAGQNFEGINAVRNGGISSGMQQVGEATRVTNSIGVAPLGVPIWLNRFSSFSYPRDLGVDYILPASGACHTPNTGGSRGELFTVDAALPFQRRKGTSACDNV
jgi:hypothetical protein